MSEEDLFAYEDLDEFDDELDLDEEGEDFEEEEDPEDDDMDEEDEEDEEGEGDEFNLNIVEDEEEFAQVILKQKTRADVKTGVNTGNQLKKIYANMLARVPKAEVNNVSFSYLSEDEKKRMSVVTITKTKDTNLGQETLNDPNMGPIYPGKFCNICFRTATHCPGHYGRIEIPKIIHPLADNVVTQVLKSVCHSCAKLLTSEKAFYVKNIDKMKGLDRLAKLADMASTSCSNVIRVKKPNGEMLEKVCGTIQRKYSKVKSDNTVQYETQNKTMVSLYPSEIFTIFDNISDRDAVLMGFGDIESEGERKPGPLTMHPRNLIVQSILVPPNRIRPRIEDSISGNGDWSDTADPEFKACISSAKEWLTALTKEDKHKHATNIWRCYKQILVGEPNAKGGRQTMSTKTRFKGKNGIFAHVIGKRSEQAGRSVISPGNWAGFGRVVVPEFMRYKLTIPETVFQLNQKKLQRDLRKGEIMFIIRKNGAHAGFRIAVTEEIRRNYILEIGDKVRRMVRNNDVVFFGRQPSLDSTSLMAMRVVIGQDNTFQFSLAHTKGYAGKSCLQQEA